MLGIEVLWKIVWEVLAYGAIPLAALSVMYLLVRKIFDELTLPRCAACGKPAPEVRLGRFYCRRCARDGDRRFMRDLEEWKHDSI